MITVSHLTHQYRLHNHQWISALDDISFTLKENEYVAIMGPNGSGKTTLVQCLNGLMRPSSGRIHVDHLDALDPKNQWEVRRRVGMVFQNPDNQIISATVEREIAFGLENLGLSTPIIQARVEETLKTVHLLHYRHYPPHRLSGGEKQRLTIASVMAMEPKYLILDEPTSLLDPQNRHAFISLLHEIQSERKTTILHVTQFPEEAVQADRLIVLVEGRIVTDGIPQSIFEQSSELTQWGLEAPLVFQLNGELKKTGVSLPHDILTGQGEYVSMKPAGRPSGSAQSQKHVLESGLLTTEKLSHTYNSGLPTQTTALKDISLSVQKGECVGIIGSTGSGKTTLAEHFIGLLKPSSGSVRIEGLDLWAEEKKMPALRRKVGLVFQFPELQFFEENVHDEVAFGPRNSDIGALEIEAYVNDALELVGLSVEDFRHRSPLSLSSGEKRLVAIASNLSMKPEILVLDEPTAGLDPQGVQRIYGLIQKLHTAGTTVVLISHNIDLVAQVTDRTVVLHEGAIVLQGPTQDVFEHEDILLSIGLDIPELTKVMRALRQKGWKIQTHARTLHEAVEEIVTHLPPTSTDHQRE